MFWFAARMSLLAEYCRKWNLFVIWALFKLNEERGMMWWRGEKKSNFGIDVIEIPKKKLTSILVIVSSKCFPHGPQKSAR